MHPAIDQSPSVVVGQGCRLAGSPGQRTREQIRLHEHLESVANSDDRLGRFDESPQGIAEVVDDLICQYFSSSNVVAVAESAGNRQDLELFQQRWVFQNAINVNELRFRTGELKRVGGFGVAIDACGAEDQGRGLHAEQCRRRPRHFNNRLM